jgi:hypothetical protein
MMRYACGVLLVALVATMYPKDGDERDEVLKSVLLAAVGVGAGVGINRLLDS